MRFSKEELKEYVRGTNFKGLAEVDRGEAYKIGEPMAVEKRNPKDQWCLGTEEFANCANCYRRGCEKRASAALLGLPTATSLGQDNFGRGRQFMAKRGGA